MKCPDCGAENYDSAVYCSLCGRAFRTDPPRVPAVASAVQPSQPLPPARGKRSRLLLLGAALVLVALMVGAAFVLLRPASVRVEPRGKTSVPTRPQVYDGVSGFDDGVTTLHSEDGTTSLFSEGSQIRLEGVTAARLLGRSRTVAILESGGGVSAVSPDGVSKWRSPASLGSMRGGMLFGSMAGATVRLDPETGEVVWSTPLQSLGVIAGNGLAFAPCLTDPAAGLSSPAAIACLDAESGKERWRVDFGKSEKAGEPMASPAKSSRDYLVVQPGVYPVPADDEDVSECLLVATKDGRVVRKVRDAFPVTITDKTFVSLGRDGLTGTDPASGRRRWTMKPLLRDDVEWLALPLSDGRIVMTNEMDDNEAARERAKTVREMGGDGPSGAPVARAYDAETGRRVLEIPSAAVVAVRESGDRLYVAVVKYVVDPAQPEWGAVARRYESRVYRLK